MTAHIGLSKLRQRSPEKTIEDLEKQNSELSHALKKQKRINFRLLKRLQREPDLQEELQEEPEEEAPKIERCPACKSTDLVVFDSGRKQFKICKVCTWRRPI